MSLGVVVRRGIFLFWEKAKSAFLKFDASG